MNHVEGFLVHANLLQGPCSRIGGALCRDDSPFRIPTNEEIFSVKEDRKKLREAERKALAQQSLHERGTSSSAIKGLAADSTRKRDVKFASARQ